VKKNNRRKGTPRRGREKAQNQETIDRGEVFSRAKQIKTNQGNNRSQRGRENFSADERDQEEKMEEKHPAPHHKEKKPKRSLPGACKNV